MIDRFRRELTLAGEGRTSQISLYLSLTVQAYGSCSLAQTEHAPAKRLEIGNWANGQTDKSDAQVGLAIWPHRAEQPGHASCTPEPP